MSAVQRAAFSAACAKCGTANKLFQVQSGHISELTRRRALQTGTAAWLWLMSRQRSAPLHSPSLRAYNRHGKWPLHLRLKQPQERTSLHDPRRWLANQKPNVSGLEGHVAPKPGKRTQLAPKFGRKQEIPTHEHTEHVQKQNPKPK